MINIILLSIILFIKKYINFQEINFGLKFFGFIIFSFGFINIFLYNYQNYYMKNRRNILINYLIFLKILIIILNFLLGVIGLIYYIVFENILIRNMYKHNLIGILTINYILEIIIKIMESF